MNVHELPRRITLELMQAVHLMFDVDDGVLVAERADEFELAFRLDGQRRMLSDKLAEAD